MGTVSIPLSSNKYPGLFALIDGEDLPLVSGSSWFPFRSHTDTFYAARTGVNRKGVDGMEFLHNVIMQPPEEKVVDHIFGHTLDCRRSQMRLCDPDQNRANRQLGRNSTSGYKGVNWHKREEAWHARVRHDGNEYYLGAFDTPEEAARAYDRKAILVFGEFARTNFPREDYGEIPIIEKRARRNNTLGYTGVSYDPRAHYWYARIVFGGKQHHIGTYATAEEAARAYDTKAREVHGGRARLNYPDV